MSWHSCEKWENLEASWIASLYHIKGQKSVLINPEIEVTSIELKRILSLLYCPPSKWGSALMAVALNSHSKGHHY